MLNAYHDPVTFVVPDACEQGGWQVLVDSGRAAEPDAGLRLRPGQQLNLRGRSLMLLGIAGSRADPGKNH
jgi:hypothetical protein